MTNEINRMTEEEIEEVLFMQRQAAKYGLEYEVEQAFNSYINAGDSVCEAVWCALSDWDIL